VEYKQYSSLLTLDQIKCLRGQYAKNSCQNCIDICPNSTITFNRGKLFLESNCINCAICIGVCPSEALNLDSFSPNEFVINFTKSKSKELSCKSNSACISSFDSKHLISMVLKSNSNVGVDLSSCLECDLNRDNKVLNSINIRVNESNLFLEKLNFKYKLEPLYSKELNKRGIFKKLFNSIKEINRVSNDKNFDREIEDKRVKFIPIKQTIFRNAILDKIDNDTLDINLNTLIFSKNIDFDSCNNCKECVEFCPTGALFYSEDMLSIYFQSSKCIGCAICNDICKENSITNSENIDLVMFATNRAKELIKHNLVICKECKIPFSYKGGDKICERCSSFHNEFKDMFKLATDL